jgi:hypothetical protein
VEDVVAASPDAADFAGALEAAHEA